MTKTEEEKKVIENIGLVHATIKKYVNLENCKYKYEYDDLYQIGSIGLWKAIKTFDVSKHTNFSSYAVPVIKNTIYSEIKEKNNYIDSCSSLDDEDNFYYKEHPVFVESPENKIENCIIKEKQKEILFKIAKNYTGISRKGVIALQLMTEGYSCNEIAIKFVTNSQNITAWMSRARNKLKKEKALLAFLER